LLVQVCKKLNFYFYIIFGLVTHLYHIAFM
jgi:hypothetical protein